MTAVLERVDLHLRRVESLSGREVVDADVPVDFGRHLAHALALLEQAKDARSVLDPRWSVECVERFATDVHLGLVATWAAATPASERAALIDLALTLAIGDPRMVMDAESGLSSVMRARISALAREARSDLRSPWSLFAYCGQLGLVSRSPVPAIALAGTMFLRLRGVDQLRWLLALECVQSYGPTDPWRVDPSTMAAILRDSGTVWSDDDPDDRRPSPWITTKRLEDLGILELFDEIDGFNGFEVTPRGRELLEELTSGDDSPFLLAARGLLEDGRADALGTSPTAKNPVTTATLRHARLIAHEIRNALLPVSHALDKVWRGLEGTPLAAELSKPRRRIEQGITRLHRFVDQSVRLSPPIGDEPGGFAVLEAVEEARRELHGEITGSVSVEARPGDANPVLAGHRGRFVLALLNVMRNAIQVAGEDVRLRITIDARARAQVTLSIEDDGPGVPEERRSAVLQNGVSGRREGTGRGLTLVREVIEEEMGGRVSLDDSDLGGARFSLTLPNPKATT